MVAMKFKESMNIIKSLADSSRLSVLNALQEKPQCLEELAERLNLASSTVSFHLKKLEKAGIVSKEKHQYYVVFSVNRKLLDISVKELVMIEDIEKAIQEERLEQYRQKILKTFFHKGKLQQMPVQHKKRYVILQEFAGKFEKDRKYSEVEVNEIIKKTYADYCLIRREMIEERLMERQGQTYWLNNAPSTDSIHLQPRSADK
jgi:predicted transcriptional regulator